MHIAHMYHSVLHSSTLHLPLLLMHITLMPAFTVSTLRLIFARCTAFCTIAQCSMDSVARLHYLHTAPSATCHVGTIARTHPAPAIASEVMSVDLK